MIKNHAILCLAGCLALLSGCAESDQFGQLKETMRAPVEDLVENDIERVQAEYVIYYLNWREHDLFEPSWSKINPLNMLPVHLRWLFTYDPTANEVIAHSSYHRFLDISIPVLAEDKSKDISIALSRQQALGVAESVLERRFLDFVNNRYPEFSYDDVKLAADRIRIAFLRDLFMYELPVALGPPVVPLLIRTVETTQDRLLISGCITNLQIVTGIHGPPDNRYDPDMTPREARRTLDPWRRWVRENLH